MISLFLTLLLSPLSHAEVRDLPGTVALSLGDSAGSLRDTLQIRGQAADHLFAEMTGAVEVTYGEIGEGKMRIGENVSCMQDFIVQTICFIKVKDYKKGEI